MDCTRLHPNIIKVAPIGGLTQEILSLHTLTVEGFYLSSSEEYDEEEVHFGIFIY